MSDSSPIIRLAPRGEGLALKYLCVCVVLLAYSFYHVFSLFCIISLYCHYLLYSFILSLFLCFVFVCVIFLCFFFISLYCPEPGYISIYIFIYYYITLGAPTYRFLQWTTTRLNNVLSSFVHRLCYIIYYSIYIYTIYYYVYIYIYI